MTYCSSCGKEVAPGSQFCAGCGAPVEGEAGEAPPPVPASTPTGGSSSPREARVPHIESHLAKAVIATVLCCLPLGIVAIVYAAKVDGQRSSGDIKGALISSSKADSWGNIAIGSGLVFGVLYFFFLMAVTTL